MALNERVQQQDTPPVRVAILNDYEVVVRGIAAMLAPFSDRVEVVELDSGLPVSQPVHVLLYDTYAAAAVDSPEVDRLARDPMVEHTVLYTWAITDEVIQIAATRHVSGMLSKSLGGAELVDALERIYAGQSVISAPEVDEDTHEGDWPGKEQGLTPRQSEVVVLVVAGLSNQEIAHRCYLSMNSVKSYLRAAYRTMGVNSRTQAVLWGVAHGFRASPQARLFPHGDDHEVPRSRSTPL